MRTPAPADCLRVARALLNLSQRDAAAGAGITQRSLSAAENSKSVLLETNLQLVDFYARQGIEFLGEAAIGMEAHRTGARWVAPGDPEAPRTVKGSFHGEDRPISFRAARALLELEQAEVAASAGLSLAVVQNLERGRKSDASYEKLRDWYEQEGVEFTGWGDVATDRFYGVGVRWKMSRPQDDMA